MERGSRKRSWSRLGRGNVVRQKPRAHARVFCHEHTRIKRPAGQVVVPELMIACRGCGSCCERPICRRELQSVLAGRCSGRRKGKKPAHWRADVPRVTVCSSTRTKRIRPAPTSPTLRAKKRPTCGPEGGVGTPDKILTHMSPRVRYVPLWDESLAKFCAQGLGQHLIHITRNVFTESS